jgi:hypothetical protein
MGRPCPNCATPLDDRFCPQCGQRNVERLVSLRLLLREALEDQLSLEARLPRTLGALLGKPGGLTSEYAAGRIARYIPPFRLYVVTGVLFFLVVSFVASFDLIWGTLDSQITEVGGEEATVVVVNIPVDTTWAPAPLRPLARRYVQQEDRINALPAREALRVLYGGTLSNVSVIVFLLVPGFALLLKLLYRRRLYVEHLVFVLHLHSAFFLVALVPLLVPSPWTSGALAMWFLVYLYLALRRVYRQSVLRTAWKYGVLLAMYQVALIATIFAVIVATVLMF